MRLSSSRQGRLASEPRECTVSVCPTSKMFPAEAWSWNARIIKCWPKFGTSNRSMASTQRAVSAALTSKSTTARLPEASPEGDSVSTNVCINEIIRGCRSRKRSCNSLTTAGEISVCIDLVSKLSAPCGKLCMDRFFTASQRIYSISIDIEAQARFLRRDDCSARRHGNWRFDDVLFPVSGARRYIARQRESREGSHGDVMGATNARLEHATTPHGNFVFPAYLFNLLCLRMSANPAKLEVDYPGRTKPNCMPGVST